MPPAIDDADSAAIVLRDVSVSYDTALVLDRVTFSAPAGTITGLLGRNGAGKSTTIRMLAGLLAPDTGEVSVLGGRFPENGQAIRMRTGYLLSDPALFAYLTAEETLCFVGEAYGQSRDEARRRAHELIAYLELDGVESQLVQSYSTGMMKRLSLAAALIHSTDLLVLDEPFETLDPLTVRRVRHLLQAYAKRGGTVFLSSHLIASLEEICDRVAILERGRLVLEGTMDAARAQLATSLPEASLEEIYASTVIERAAGLPTWIA
ncbi:MAG: ABC transporter ATP-binding protein [bacterium]